MPDPTNKFQAGEFLQTCSDVVAAHECDKNNHLNVQYYVERFIKSVQRCGSNTDAQGKENLNPRDMHFRFHRELLAGAGTKTYSAMIEPTEGQARVLHVLCDDASDAPSATSLCLTEDTPDQVPTIAGSVPDFAAQRALPWAPYEPVDTQALLSNDLALTTMSGVVSDKECGETQALRTDLMVKKFHDAAMSLWQFVGFDPTWFSKGNYGGVAAEMKLTQFGVIDVGQSFEIVSWVPSLTSNVLHLANQLNESASGRPVARICAASMIFDRKTRRPVEFPQSVREYYAKKFAAFSDLSA